MKTLRNSLFLITGICLMISCSKSDELPFPEDSQEGAFKSAHGELKTVTVPFKADFSVWDKSDYTDEACGGAPVFVATMEGSGNIAHLGLMTTKMTFCVDVSTGYYYNTVGSFVAANGDILNLIIPEGQIYPNDEDNSDYYQTKFNDKIIFVGGTGRFEGASGEAYTNAYVHDGTDEWRTDFFSKGSLILVKGKR